MIAQAFATLEELFPGRFWAAKGSREAVNEHVTGEGWPAKQIRNERRRESVDLSPGLSGSRPEPGVDV